MLAAPVHWWPLWHVDMCLSSGAVLWLHVLHLAVRQLTVWLVAVGQLHSGVRVSCCCMHLPSSRCRCRNMQSNRCWQCCHAIHSLDTSSQHRQPIWHCHHMCSSHGQHRHCRHPLLHVRHCLVATADQVAAAGLCGIAASHSTVQLPFLLLVLLLLLEVVMMLVLLVTMLVLVGVTIGRLVTCTLGR